MTWNTPSTWTGVEVTSAQMNAQVRDNFKAIGDAWGSFTSTTTNITLGTGGTTAGAYRQAGKAVEFRIKVTLGTGGALTGSPTFTLPVTASAVHTVACVMMMFDSSAGSSTAYKVGAAFNSSTTQLLVRDDASAVLSATNPFPWADGDKIVIVGSYEAA